MTGQSPMPSEVELDVGSFVKDFLKKLPYVLIFIIISSILIYLFLGTLEPRFRSEAMVLIETRETGLTLPTQSDREPTTEILDQEAIVSQVQLILSRDLAQTVSDKLDLAGRSEFIATGDMSRLPEVVTLPEVDWLPAPER